MISEKQKYNMTSTILYNVCKYTGTLLRNYVDKCNTHLVGLTCERQNVLTYVCSDFTYEQFGSVFRIMTRQHVTRDEIQKNRHVVRAFGPFSQILVDLAGASASSNIATGLSLSLEAKSIERRAHATAMLNDGVLVCESQERTQVLTQHCRALSLPYLPFRLVFVQGSTEVETPYFQPRQSANDIADSRVKHIEITPIWISLVFMQPCMYQTYIKIYLSSRK